MNLTEEEVRTTEEIIKEALPLLRGDLLRRAIYLQQQIAEYDAYGKRLHYK